MCISIAADEGPQLEANHNPFAQEGEDLVFPVMKSPDGEAYFPKGKESYYTSYYRAATLPSMLHKREEDGNIRFRLAMFPSFSKPLFLTYSRGLDGASIEITRLQLRWDDDILHPVGIDLSGKVDIGNRIAELLEEEVVRPRIRMPLSHLAEEHKQMFLGTDGTSYVIEVSTNTDYSFSSLWTPEGILGTKKIWEDLSQQNVEIDSLVDDLKKFIVFRDLLLDLVGLKEPRYTISELLDDG